MVRLGGERGGEFDRPVMVDDGNLMAKIEIFMWTEFGLGCYYLFVDFQGLFG
jgi:hypothetical protein